MATQIFRRPVPKELLFDLLDKICLKTNDYYLVDLNAYRVFVYDNNHLPFVEQLSSYYHSSKNFYVKREMTYNSFTNLIRQICKSNNFRFTSQIKYHKSKYSIEYLVYF
jgi:hypothetical protein